MFSHLYLLVPKFVKIGLAGVTVVALERNRIMNIPFFSNAAQPQPLTRFSLFLSQNPHCYVLVCTSNPNFEIITPDVAHSTTFKLLLTMQLV